MDLKSLKFQIDLKFNVVKKNTHVLNEDDFIKQNTSISFETLYWLIGQAEKVQKLQQKSDAKIMFISNGKEEELYSLQEKVIRYEKNMEELISLVLWCARRLHKSRKGYVYDDLEKITEQNYERL